LAERDVPTPPGGPRFLPQRIQPLGTDGVSRGEDGVLRYASPLSTIVQMLAAAVEKYPDRPALREVGGERLTYQELWDRAAVVAGGLREAGISPGDRVAIHLGNGIDWCLAFFGAQLAGAVAVPVNTRFAESEVEYVVADAEAALVISADAGLPSGPPHAWREAGPDTLAALFYTSGTTGFPKGAMTTHDNFLATAETFRRQADRPGPEACTLISVPLFHVTGCNSQFLPMVKVGGCSVILPEFSVSSFLEAIRDENVNILVAVPSIYWLAIQQPEFDELDVSSVKVVGYGGAPIAPDLVRRIMRAFPEARLVNGYGLSETAATSTSLSHEYAETRPESVGLAVPIVELDLLDVDPTSGVGELAIRGQNVTQGYWRKPEATAAAFVGGWVRTGDLARVDDDGFVVLVDRKKDMINRGGENVYCVEVENALAEHPGVYESAVLSVPDDMLGEAVGAVVVSKPGGEVEPRELRDFLSGRIADFKVPQYISVRPELLPRNPGGKILKPRLRDEADWGEKLP
jgi:long-chain acyl-CoA synthetase